LTRDNSGDGIPHMAAVLGKVWSEPSAARGPDVAMSVRVPAKWLGSDAVLRVTLPRRLPCARCDGGGCDRCERRGAITLREEGASPEWVDVSVGLSAEQAVTLRIPEHGGHSNEGFARGLLLLTLCPAEQPDPAVQLYTPPRETLSW